MGLAETAELSVRIGLDDKMSAGLGRINSNLKKFEGSTKRVGRGVGEIGRGFARAGLVAGGAIALGLAGAAKSAIDFQDAFQGVVKTVDEADLVASGGSFQGLSDAIRKMSREMPNTAIELANIAAAAGALGVKGKDIESFTRQVAILASTTNVSADDAATALGQLQNVIGLTGDEFDNFAAALVDLGNKGASTESDILEIARRSGGAAKLFGVAKEETLGWAAAAANLGLNAELAGTSLQKVFLGAMQKASGGSKSLATVMGISAKAVKKAFAEDATGALEMFIRKLRELPKAERLDAVQSVFGKGSGVTRLVLGLADSIDTNLTPALKDSAQAWKDATAAQVEFEKRNSTVKSAFERLRNNVIDAAVTIGEGFAPALGRAADKLSKFLSMDGNRSKLKSIGEDLGKAIDKIDFDRLLKTAEGVVSALKPAVGILTSIAEIIGKLPPELLGAGGAVVITNKVTGGLILKGTGDVVGGLAESLFKGLATHIPIFGKAFVQPVFVTNQGFGGGGGGGLPPETPALGGGIAVPAVGAVAVLDMVEGQKHANVILAQVRDELQRRNGGTGSLTGGAPGRGGAKPSAGLTGGAPGRGISAVGKKLDSLHHAAIPAINTVGNKVTAAKGSAERSQHSSTHVIGAKIARSTAAMNDTRHAVDGSRRAVTGKLSSSNAKLDAIRHKRTSFKVVNNIGISTRVSVSAFQHAQEYYSHVTRSTSLSSGDFGRGKS